MAHQFTNLDIESNKIMRGQPRDTVITEDFDTMTFQQFLKSFENIVLKSLPAIIVMVSICIIIIRNLAYFHLQLICIWCMETMVFNKIHKKDVVGVGFGTIWLNITLHGIIINANMSIATIMSRYYRDQNYFKLGICYQRGLLISGIYLIIITPFLGFSHKIFSLIGIEDSIIEPSVQYAWEAVPGAWSFCFFDMTKNYLQSMNIYYPLIIIQSFTSILHYIMAKTLIFDFQLNVRGAAWAKNFSDTIAALLVYLYIVKYHTHHPSWVEWDKAALKSIGTFSKSLFALGFKYFIQGASFEIMVFFAVHLGFSQMGVSVCLAFTAQAIFMIFLGVAQVVQSTINEHLKNMDVQGAKQRSIYFIISTFIVGLLVGIVLRIFRQDWVEIFGLKEDSQEKMLDMLNLFTITLLIDGIQISMGTILNAIGFHSFTLNVQLLAQYGVGISTGIYLTYYKGQGIEGLWLGWALGLSVSVFALLMKLSVLDWELAVQNVIVRVQIPQK